MRPLEYTLKLCREDDSFDLFEKTCLCFARTWVDRQRISVPETYQEF